MATTRVHKEDVKAALRKKYGSVEAAQAAMGFAGTQLRDLLRGRTSRNVHAAVAKELGIDPAHLVITTGVIHKSGDKNRQSSLRSDRSVAA
ncbi:helix-turn-helix domain-containing protein [Novosphingobium sp. NDB2Meth1]|uniref:helix-turn-helix domain-containing protein n=1 Tax=Novosphingobium sp. NDB2Meth1 TaxID=1892847 RepID=UPI0009308186|nr:helix-turn-helix domain-containing protein [Novosphingobium sp. NDB2Meth1]